jgi:hypothetical protein
MLGEDGVTVNAGVIFVPTATVTEADPRALL